MLDNKNRNDIHIGAIVDIVLKKDQPTGILTRGKVKRILTNKKYHPRGIKVMLEDNQVGRVQKIIEDVKQNSFHDTFSGSLDDILEKLKKE